MGADSGSNAPRPDAGMDTLDGPAPEGIDPEAIRLRVIEVLHDIHDPEIPVNIYDLGLVYGVEVDTEGRVQIRMTLTTPSCPEAASIPGFVQSRVGLIPRVREVRVDLVWDPPWTQERMSEAARLQLGMF